MRRSKTHNHSKIAGKYWETIIKRRTTRPQTNLTSQMHGHRYTRRSHRVVASVA
jgi:hypothetical protein